MHRLLVVAQVTATVPTGAPSLMYHCVVIEQLFEELRGQWEAVPTREVNTFVQEKCLELVAAIALIPAIVEHGQGTLPWENGRVDQVIQARYSKALSLCQAMDYDRDLIGTRINCRETVQHIILLCSRYRELGEVREAVEKACAWLHQLCKYFVEET